MKVHSDNKAGMNTLGTYNGCTNLETFLSKFQNCVDYFGWNRKDQLFQMKNALVDAAGLVVNEVDVDATLSDIIKLLKMRFGNEHQSERFRVEMKSRRRKPGETLQTLYTDLCRLKFLAFGKSVENEFSQYYMRDAFLDAINDRDLRKQILIQEPATMEGSPASRSTLRSNRCKQSGGV